MNSSIRAIARIEDADDVSGALVAGSAPVYGGSGFVLTPVAPINNASLTGTTTVQVLNVGSTGSNGLLNLIRGDGQTVFSIQNLSEGVVGITTDGSDLHLSDCDLFSSQQTKIGRYTGFGGGPVYIYQETSNNPVVIGSTSAAVSGNVIDMALPTAFRTTLTVGGFSLGYTPGAQSIVSNGDGTFRVVGYDSNPTIFGGSGSGNIYGDFHLFASSGHSVIFDSPLSIPQGKWLTDSNGHTVLFPGGDQIYLAVSTTVQGVLTAQSIAATGPITPGSINTATTAGAADGQMVYDTSGGANNGHWYGWSASSLAWKKLDN